ncbi:hypothetical protein BD410DRAFT_788016 [Rickenella mellea]|uniref:F-box domain-containing protein n=1 Tax=Rickenella mellea TaxID=50990 RepID=A0A4Y7Q5Z0_9AGAM|nr:hypothetical protein BD410DRAFT_788016 [Rickenella mellea]
MSLARLFVTVTSTYKHSMINASQSALTQKTTRLRQYYSDRNADHNDRDSNYCIPNRSDDGTPIPPVHRLPDELLSNIILTFASGNAFWKAASFVCRRWRTVTLGTALLWTHISSSYPGDQLDGYLTRSKQAPLTAAVYLGSDNYATVSKIYEHLWRIRVLQLSLENSRQISHYEVLLAKPAPVLESLTVYNSDDEPDPQHHLDVPTTLRSLTLHRVYCHLGRGVLQNLSSLTLQGLSKRVEKSSVSQLVDILRACPNLVLLQVADCGVLLANFDSESNRVALPMLRVLDIDHIAAFTAAKLLSCLQIPRSTMIYVHCVDYSTHNPFGILPRRHGASLVHEIYHLSCFIYKRCIHVQIFLDRQVPGSRTESNLQCDIQVADIDVEQFHHVFNAMATIATTSTPDNASCSSLTIHIIWHEVSRLEIGNGPWITLLSAFPNLSKLSFITRSRSEGDIFLDSEASLAEALMTTDRVHGVCLCPRLRVLSSQNTFQTRRLNDDSFLNLVRCLRFRRDRGMTLESMELDRYSTVPSNLIPPLDPRSVRDLLTLVRNFHWDLDGTCE